LIPKDLEIGRKGRVTKMDNTKGKHSIVHTMMDANFERRFLEMENHLAHLAKLLAFGVMQI